MFRRTSLAFYSTLPSRGDYIAATDSYVLSDDRLTPAHGQKVIAARGATPSREPLAPRVYCVC